MAPMERRSFLASLALLGASASLPRMSVAAAGWRAGAASVVITPADALWMAGYARRIHPARGAAMPLHAKALALEGGGRRAVLVTVDLLGVTGQLTGHVLAGVAARFGLRPADLILNASHTHSGPVVDDQLSVAYDLAPEDRAAIARYSRGLVPALIELVGSALGALQPAELAYATGTASFGVNRRTPGGPVDPTVPVLRVTRGERLLAVVFGYACHNTTLQHEMLQYHGDYAGVAQATLEARHPGATALYVAGCGADINPHPRGTLEHVEAHGRTLGEVVDGTLQRAAPIDPALETRHRMVNLPFADAETRAAWHRGLKLEPVHLERHARLMDDIIARDGRLPTEQAAPLHVWRLGRDLTFAAIGGEVVVDYALRLAADYPDRRIWAAGYSSDVFGYLPSERVLREGGYEGADAMIYYGRPGPFAAGVEALVHEGIRSLVTS